MRKKDLERQRIRRSRNICDYTYLSELIPVAEEILNLDRNAYIQSGWNDYDECEILITYETPEEDHEYNKRIKRLQKQEDREKRAKARAKARQLEKDLKEFERLQKLFGETA